MAVWGGGWFSTVQLKMCGLGGVYPYHYQNEVSKNSGGREDISIDISFFYP